MAKKYKKRITPQTVLALEMMAQRLAEAYLIDERYKDRTPLFEMPRFHIPTAAERKEIRRALRWCKQMADELRSNNPGITDPAQMIINARCRRMRSQRQKQQQRPDEAAQDAIIKSYVTLPSNGHQASTASSMQKRASRSMSENHTAAGSTTPSRDTSERGKLMRRMTRKAGAAVARLTTAIGS